MMNGPMDTTMPLPAGHGFGGARMEVDRIDNAPAPIEPQEQEGLLSSFRGG